MSRQARARGLRARLSDRDLAILKLLSRLRLMTGAQLRRVYFPAGNQITQARKMRAVLQRLAELGTIVRLSRRIGGERSGSEGHVVGLSGLGHAVLDVNAATNRRHRSVSETKLAFEEHVLSVSELFVQLHEAAADGHDELLRFDGEPAAWRRFSGMGGQTITLKPDAFVQLGIDDYELAAFIEVDNSTESLPTIARKLEVYAAYFRSGQEQREHGVFPRVWWLVPDIGRFKGIARTIQRLPDATQTLFTIALQHEAADQLFQLPTQGGAR